MWRDIKVMKCIPGGTRKLAMGSKTLGHCSGVPERAIMVPPSVGMVFKGWGDGGARALPLPLPSDMG